MRIHDIVGYTTKKRRVTTTGDGSHRIPDLVQRDFDPEALDVTLCGDISYIRHLRGFPVSLLCRGSGVAAYPRGVDGQPPACRVGR